MFEMGFCVGLIIGILAMLFIPWKCCGRQNIKVAELSASTNKKRNAIPHHGLPDDFGDFMREEEAYNFHHDCGDR